MKNNFKEIAHLLRISHGEDFVNIIQFFKFRNKGVGTILATKDLYFSLLDKTLDKKSSDGDAYWIKKPKGTVRVDLIADWIKEINLEHLLLYSSKTTLRNAFGCLHKSGLLHIDEFNRVFIKYPVDGKMLSPKFAAVAILSKKKKDKKVDEISKDSVSSAKENEAKFWEDLG